MIKFEYNMLVLNNTFSNEDVQEINAFADYVRKQERDRIIEVIRDWYEADADLIEGPGNLIDWIENGENE